MTKYGNLESNKAEALAAYKAARKAYVDRLDALAGTCSPLQALRAAQSGEEWRTPCNAESACNALGVRI